MKTIPVLAVALAVSGIFAGEPQGTRGGGGPGLGRDSGSRSGIRGGIPSFGRRGRTDGPEVADREARIAYLKKSALPIRSLDPGDTDFSDLEPLRRVIGNRRVVMLGEATHGDGAVLAVKTRLIKFLHERMGFDVLALEGGFYDVQKAWSDLRAGADPVRTMRSAVFEEWADARQAEPLWRYVAERLKSNRPLELAGFDLQFTGRVSTEYLVKDLIGYLARTGLLPETADLVSRIAEPLQRLLTDSLSFQKIGPDDRALVLEAIGHLGRTLERMPPGSGPGAAERGFWIQALRSGAAMMEMAWAVDLDSFKKKVVDSGIFNMRDRQMGENFLWLANRAYPARKIIVWAATSHIIRNRGSLEEGKDPLVPMGDWVDKAMGAEVYTLGFTAYRGRWGTPAMSRPVDVKIAAEDSLEDLLFKASLEFAWLDFRNPAADGLWLREPLPCRALGYQSRTADWTRVMDGIFFVREMFPSTRMEIK